jgi:hypothetical protein
MITVARMRPARVPDPQLVLRADRPGSCRNGGTRLTVPPVAAAALFLVLVPIGAGYGQLATDTAIDRVEPADSLRAQFHVPVAESARSPAFQRVGPAMGASSPTGYGARAGDLYLGAALQLKARSYWRRDGTQVDPPVDGAIAGGVGFGNPERLLGLQVDVISFSTVRSGVGTNMGVDLKVHRALPHQIGLALGYESAFVRGETDSGSSRYAVLSKWTALREDSEGLFGSLVISAGMGDGRFRPVDAWNEDSSRFYPFGSIGLRIFEPLSVIADWTGQDLAVVVSVAPFRRLPAVASLGFRDVAGSGYPSPRFVAAASYAFRYPVPAF